MDSDKEFEQQVKDNFIKQILELSKELREQGRNQEAMDLEFRAGFVIGLAAKEGVNG